MKNNKMRNSRLNSKCSQILNQFLLISVLAYFNISIVFAQSVPINKPPDIKYRRSSLHTILIESDRFPFKDTVIRAYYNAPFPEKYNNHCIGEKSFDPKKYLILSDESESYKAIIDLYLSENKIANKLVAKWFNRKDDGSFDMNLIGERGSYNASEMEANIAQKSARGLSSLADAGEELIGNTFVVFSKLNFVSNEIAAAITRDAAKAAADQIPDVFVRIAAKKAADIAYKKLKEGYSVWTKSYLYRLIWNDSVSTVFYNDYWMDINSIDSVRKLKCDNTSLFELEYIGDENSRSLVTFSLKEKRSDEKIVEIATIRNLDAIYSKLQKSYDVFKTKTPLYTGYPITAKIGLKEGVEGGDKYEVLEQVLDEQGKTKYVRKGIIKVDKNHIWDNRFNPCEEQSEDNASTDMQIKDYTLFEGGDNYYAGMLIRQIK